MSEMKNGPNANLINASQLSGNIVIYTQNTEN